MIATVKIPISFAAFAMTGAAPVPVPPPIPAAINNISLPAITSLIISIDSSAALLPTFGSPPAPKPPAVFCPRIILFGVFDKERACLSVFAT